MTSLCPVKIPIEFKETMPNLSQASPVFALRSILTNQVSPTGSLTSFFTKRLAAMLAVIFVAITVTPVEAQSPSEEVAKLQKKLDDLNEKMSALKEKLDAGEGNLNSMQQDYSEALLDANEVISSLHDTCLDAVEKDPSNQKNIRTVMGILLNDADAGQDGKVLRSCDRLINAGVNKAYFDYAARAERISLDAREIFDEVLIRQREHKADDLPKVLLKTNKGDITVLLYENEAPQTVGNFISLVESGFYSQSLFHRVIDNFMAQVGGPKKDDEGDDDPGYLIYDEHKNPDTRPHFTGVLSMANTGAPNSGSSQFFITFDRTTHLDGKHTVFGRVIDGHDIVDRIVRTQIEINGQSTAVPNASPDFIESATVIRKRDHKYRPRKVGEPEEVDEPELPPVTQKSKSFDEDDPKMEEKKAEDSEVDKEAKSDEPESAKEAGDDDKADDMSKDVEEKVEDSKEVDADAGDADQEKATGESEKTEEPSDS